MLLVGSTKGHENIVITVIDLEAADLDAHNVTHAEAIAKLPIPRPY